MLEKKVLKTIQKYDLIKNGDNIVVGVSGGPDSMALLNVLININNNTDLKFKINVAHVNHMIRREADAEAEYVKEFCKQNNIECFIKKIDVNKIAKINKIGTEEAGRNIRYDFFYEILNKVNANKIATAHNANDNVETVLMNIIRGSGTTGLRGIEPVRDILIRPLIECERQQIEEYTIEKKLKPCIDKSNKENIYTRNKTRNLLIPFIKENFNPNIISSINKLSEIATMENDFINKKMIDSYEEILVEESLGNKQTGKDNYIVLDLKKFNKLDLVIKNRIVLYTIGRTIGDCKDIEKTNIEDIVKLCNNNIGNKYITPNKRIKIIIKNRKIFFVSIN